MSSKTKIRPVGTIQNLDSLPSKEEGDIQCHRLPWITGSLYKDTHRQARLEVLTSDKSDAGAEGPQTTRPSTSPHQTKATNSRAVLYEGETGLVRFTAWVYGHQHQT